MPKTFDFLGAKELQEAFLNIPAYVNSGVVDRELIAAGKPLIKKAKEIVSHADVTGNLKKSIGALSDRKLAGEPAAIVMGPRRGRGQKGHHAHLVEYGTAPRRLNEPIQVKIRGEWKTITHTGTMPAYPFMRPAYDATVQEVADNVKRLYSKLIEQGGKGAFK